MRVLALCFGHHYISSLCLYADQAGKMSRCFDYIGGHEKNFSAESSEACEQARISLTDGNQGWPQGDCASPGAGTRPADR